MKILHTGDWHVGTFNGPTIDGENGRYIDVCNSINTLIESAKQENPDVAIVAGDIFHQAKVWGDRALKENQFVIKALRELRKICPVVVMRGTPNHDSAEQFNSLMESLKDEDIAFVTEPKLVGVITNTSEVVQVACVPGFDKGYWRAKHPGIDKETENKVFTEEISKIILGLKAQATAGFKTVLVGHYTIAGCCMESGQTAFMAQFEPVVEPDTLNAADYDLVCFGHIHRPQKLELCKNTYYCGAASALNFGDEGQERGYYIHELTGDGCNSVFHSLPSRKFKTIRLENEDIEKFNTGDYSSALFAECIDTEDGVEDAVVRVIYNCTDSANKAFNHATLESLLYHHGAYFVQEITPEKISLTVAKNRLESDSSPEENLRIYLEEKGFNATEAGTIIELAFPIIQSAEAMETESRSSGLLIPREISVKNYRNYREETFSFDTISFCTINGENGVGKSSLFMDAIIDALYEEPREGDLTGWICNDPEARSGSITFTFSIGEEVYRVCRTRQKSGRATLNISKQQENEWINLSKEKYKDTQAVIEEIVGMNSMNLKACALIMQDQYGLFLQADKEARMSILGNILGLGIYQRMEEIASNKYTDSNRVRTTLNEQIDAITATCVESVIIEAAISENNTRLGANDAEIKRLKGELEVKSQELATMEAEIARAERTQGQIARKTALIAQKKEQMTSQLAINTAAAKEIELCESNADKISELKKLREESEKYKKSEFEAAYLNNEKGRNLEALTATIRKICSETEKISATEQKIVENNDILLKAAEIESDHEKYIGMDSKIKEIEQKQDDYNSSKLDIGAAETRFKEIKRACETSEDVLRTEIESLTRKSEMLENSSCPISDNATCIFLRDAKAAKDQLPERTAEYEALKANNQQELEKAAELIECAKAKLSECTYSVEAHSELIAEKNRLAANERAYNDLRIARACTESYQTQLEDAKKSLEALINEKSKIEAEIKSVEEQQITVNADLIKLSEIKKRISELEVFEKIQGNIAVARNNLETSSNRISELTAEIYETEEELKQLKAETENLNVTASAISNLKAAINAINTDIKYFEDFARHIVAEIGSLKKQLEENNAKYEKIKELQSKVNAEAERIMAYETLKKAFSQDGIPHNIIRSIIPIFEATASNILGQMSGGKMSVEIVTEKLLKSNNKKEVTTLDIIINDCITGRLPYMSRSGGERVKAALSVILALSEIKSSRAGIQLGFLFIDEPPFLDQQGVQAYCDALEAIQTRYSGLKIMAITHDPAMKARFPQSLDVVKTEDGSKVIY